MQPVETLLQLLEVAPEESTAIILPESSTTITYGALRRQVLSMAEALGSYGIRRNDRVATVFPNGLAAIVTFLAASIAGTAAPLNLNYRSEEFAFYLQDTGARVLLCPVDGAESARQAAARLDIPVLPVTDAGGTAMLSGIDANVCAGQPSPEDIALVLHTSGSTGKPKRVPLRHVNIAVSAQNVANTYQLSSADVSLCLMPLFHIHGLVASTLATLLTGGTIVVPAKFNPLSFWRLVRDYGVTWYSAVPTIHKLVLARSDKRPEGKTTLRFVRSCSSALAPELMGELEEKIGVPVLEAYGMTEAAHQMASNPLPPDGRTPGSVGPQSGEVRVSVMDKAGNHLQSLEPGEVVIQGPNVFSGYENNPEANASAFTNGWFRTGDQGYLDENGYLHLTARLKELINRGGEKIAPRYIDEVLLRHPAVAEAVAFGFPHPVWGEEVGAAVVLRQPESETELLKHCREHLADFSCPKKVYIVESIPKTATGKIQRGLVAAEMTKTETAA